MPVDPRLNIAIRRGMLELDVLFRRYYPDRYNVASQEEQALFARFLDCNDQELFNWLVKREPAPFKFQVLVETLLTPKHGGK